MSKAAEIEWEKLLRIVEKDELKDVEKMSRMKSVLQARKGQLFGVKVRLRHNEGNDETADYGEVVFRRWTASEVMDILADPAYQKANRVIIDGTKMSRQDLTREELDGLYRLRNKYIAVSQPEGSPLTEAFLSEMGNWAFTDFVFSVIAARSGLVSLVEDLDDFFRNTGG